MLQKVLMELIMKKVQDIRINCNRISDGLLYIDLGCYLM